MAGAVIFDFDGTIADSFDYVLDFLKAEAGNTRDFSAAEKRQLRQMSMKRLALHLGVSPWRLVSVYFKGRRVMRAHMENVQPFAGMDEVLRQLHGAGFELFITSANSGHNIRTLLRHQGILSYFKAIRGGSGFTGKSPMIRQLMIRYRLPGHTTWYVGDETGDVVAAARAGVLSLAVGWGFADPARLREVGPDAFAAKPEDIVRILTTWNSKK
jgi:phosphoglycolate phosphatase